MRAVTVIQARVGSTRLPGKVMYPLDGRPTLEHVVTRVSHADTVTNVVVATSTKPQDDVIKQYAPEFGADVIRGGESDVLSRFEQALEQYDPEIIVRVTADCPLISPRFIDASIRRIEKGDTEYVSAGFDRTFPRGLTCEAFTAESFERVCVESTDPHHREHVTPYYREHPEEFELYNLESNEVFDEPWLQGRTDIRLTLDKPADYQLLETLYREIEFDGILDIPDVINYSDEHDLATVNQHVNQKSVK
ncbi:glycosyltransferase family protein [Halostagnicola sp. A-GB9-2]|uniref:glycosyltransferase family protein n=1 Tax=Halostagnicola sp. A-GB9-2 TaxID=3048066 RepID=UPI0024C0B6F6|nr:glycosyltransferase family protein [Halostagnicola sp. A-GB9-2]MDJ1431982.1 glycosyltransferase family protein [Halostagnicola sp. A-GB9-2]